MKKQKQQYNDQTSLPIDVAFEIVSSLEAVDVCSLGSCSTFWKQICSSDCLWESLCKQRWPPALAIVQENQLISSEKSHSIKNKGWKEIYSKKHTEMAEKMRSYRKWLANERVDIEDYLKVIEDMKKTQFEFNDVIIFFFKSNLANVLLNLAGLHYSIKHLNIQVEDVIEAIRVSNIEDKEVCIQWRKKGGWMHRFPLPDQLHHRCLTLKELLIITIEEGRNEVLDVLDRGLTAVVVQLHISSSIPPECSAMGDGRGGCEFTYIMPYWEITPQIQP